MKNRRSFIVIDKKCSERGWHLNRVATRGGLVYWIDWKDNDNNWHFKEFECYTLFFKFMVNLFKVVA